MIHGGAAITPALVAEHGLKPDEYERFRAREELLETGQRGGTACPLRRMSPEKIPDPCGHLDSPAYYGIHTTSCTNRAARRRGGGPRAHRE